MDIEEYLLKDFIKDSITLIGDDGIKYTFDSRKPRHPDYDFCFKSEQYGVSQFTYKKIKHWQIIKPENIFNKILGRIWPKNKAY